ncbi:hypothetical protein CPB83DRAFT_801692 [Crepidotus variabilis]|uniref:DUF6534 domain-containing protein n=1 Tax=Crepidotus variabilis TaxID=179855 RepID=A0A9P6EUU0_9AGAR|nr:hypothetical protein CPB83DRAFT_801692 [Crepidotus variabilis]
MYQSCKVATISFGLSTATNNLKACFSITSLDLVYSVIDHTLWQCRLLFQTLRHGLARTSLHLLISYYLLLSHTSSLSVPHRFHTFHTLMGFLDVNFGSFLLGYMFAAMFYGVTCVQSFLYFQQNSKKDGWPLKSTIMLLWVVDSTHLAMATRAIYWYMVTNFGHVAALAYPHWSLIAVIFLTTISDTIVRIVYSRRVAILYSTRSKVLSIALPAAVLILSAVVFGCEVAFGYYAVKLVTFARLGSVSYLVYIGSAAEVAADLTVAISLSLLLLNSRTGIKRTDSLINILIACIINTGLLTSFCAIGCLLTYTIWPNTLIFLGCYLSLSKLYLNSLLASLIARSSLRRVAEEPMELNERHLTDFRANVGPAEIPERQKTAVTINSLGSVGGQLKDQTLDQEANRSTRCLL